MFTTTDLFCVTLLFTGFGIAIGLMAAFWRPRKSFNYDHPYHKGNGDPQPFGEWHPDYAIGNEPVKVYPSYDVWARETGAI